MTGPSRRLVELARVLRSKNAGPFAVTFDIMFDGPELLEHVVSSGAVTATAVGALYDVPAEDVSVVVFPPANAIKITMPRRVSSGSALDTDVYGTQQHPPLFDLVVPGVAGGPSSHGDRS